MDELMELTDQCLGSDQAHFYSFFVDGQGTITINDTAPEMFISSEICGGFGTIEFVLCDTMPFKRFGQTVGIDTNGGHRKPAEIVFMDASFNRSGRANELFELFYMVDVTHCKIEENTFTWTVLPMDHAAVSHQKPQPIGAGLVNEIEGIFVDGVSSQWAMPTHPNTTFGNDFPNSATVNGSIFVQDVLHFHAGNVGGSNSISLILGDDVSALTWDVGTNQSASHGLTCESNKGLYLLPIHPGQVGFSNDFVFDGIVEPWHWQSPHEGVGGYSNNLKIENQEVIYATA